MYEQSLKGLEESEEKYIFYFLVHMKNMVIKYNDETGFTCVAPSETAREQRVWIWLLNGY
jgi:hypothetical protein